MSQATQAPARSVCVPTRPLLGPASTFQYRNSASTDIRATFDRIRAQTQQAFFSHQPKGPAA